jgi:hypothetical protein
LSGLAEAAPPKGKPKAPPAKKEPPPPITAPTAKVAENVSEKVLTTLQSAGKVQAYRVISSGGLRPEPTKAIGSDFVRDAEGKELTATQLTTLRAVLYDEKSYRFAVDVAACNFNPDVSFRVESGIDTLETLVSFSCSQVLFYSGKPGGRWLPAGTYDLKPARGKLLELAKATLPGDAATQKLK